MLEKSFEAATVEPRIAKVWDDAGAFKAGAGSKPGADPYAIVIPPPNVTGSLHMGHALNNTLQDILIRFERMRGRDVLWQPGMDHAGIATQMVVERQLAASGKNETRHTMGREKFVERIWEWKKESGGLIFNQLKRLGASCDWSREKFTMGDNGQAGDQMVDAVTDVFVQLYNTVLSDGTRLIYKDKRLVNWDPKLLTAISDLEVEQIEVKGTFSWSQSSGEALDHEKLGKILDRQPSGHLYYFRYPIIDDRGHDTGEVITVATTRPETMLGDTGIAVNPVDTKYLHMHNKYARLPLVGRRLKIVPDDYSDPEKGTGAVKITPAHDFNDFEVGKRNNLSKINILSKEAKVFLKGNSDFRAGLDSVSEETMALDGLDRFVARKKIVEMMEAGGFLDKIEPHTHQVPHGDRGGVPIEPFLTEQWYVNAAELAKPAIASVREGRTKFVPENWDKTYYQWMENIQPWCISRQLWWGHQIPVWYGPIRDNVATNYDLVPEDQVVGQKSRQVLVAKTEAEAISQAEQLYGQRVIVVESERAVIRGINDPTNAVYIYRDPDVLDTWFSSALWPFSTLGWPNKTPELAKYYQTDVLVTGFDIIFFWVARMMMMGLHFMKDENGEPEAPFHTVYVHALVRDKNGQKMSKSKGNVIDPLELIDEYGADALRFTLAIMAAQGRDVKLDPTRIAGYRNFGTKLWNATRFAQMNGMAAQAGFTPDKAKSGLNRWILTELTRASRTITDSIETYRFNDAASAAYKFVWNQLCDWYVELLKPVFMGDNEADKAEAQATLAYVLDETYRLLHPFMPFMTEELWALTAGEGNPRETLLCHAEWPKPTFEDGDAAGDINWLIDLVTSIRSVRAEMNVPAGATAPIVVVGAGELTKARLTRNEASIKRLARVTEITHASDTPKNAAQLVLNEATICLPLGSLIDLDAERARLTKEQGKVQADLDKINAKLCNDRFVANAKQEVVAAERARHAELTLELQKIAEALIKLSEL